MDNRRRAIIGIENDSGGGGEGTLGLSYTLSGGGTYYICSGIGTATDTDIEIASVYEGLPVTKIDSNAFSGQSQLTSVTIPSSVTEFGQDAFNNCSGLIAVNFKGTISEWCGIKIGDWQVSANPLYYAHNLYINGQLLTDLVIPDTLTQIGTNTFINCTSIKTITFPQNGVLTKIGGMAFRQAIPASGVITMNKIPDSVTNLTYWVFHSQEALREINFGNGITSLDTPCYGCYSLSKIHLGNSVSGIIDQSFNGAGIRAGNYASKAIYTIKTLNPPSLGTGCLPGWSIPFNAYFPYAINPSTGNRSIEDYKVANRWSTWSNYMYPLVDAVSDLSGIDTTAYTKACVVGNEEYTEYEYINGQWSIVQ